MDYRKICSECNKPSDEFNTDVFGKVICGECGVQSHCFCEECDEYVPTSHCSVEDSVLDVNGMEIEESRVICNVCDENSDENTIKCDKCDKWIDEDEPSWCEDDKQICDGCVEDNSCGWYEKEKKNGVQKFTKPSQDLRGEEQKLKEEMYKNARYMNGGYFVNFRGKMFASDDLDTLFNEVKKTYLKGDK